jgi:hypothetical protein
MFRRVFWFTTGAAAGIWATTKVQRTLRGLAPGSLAAQAADRAVGAGHRLRHFALDVRAGMAQREGELHDALGITEVPGPPAPGGQRELPERSGLDRIGPAPVRPGKRTTDGVG